MESVYQTQGPSLLAGGTVITGQVKLADDLRIDGSVVGDIISEKAVIIGPGGEVRGNITAALLDIYGSLHGDAGITGLTVLRNGAILNGDLKATELEIESGARFEGQCAMAGTGPSPGGSGEADV
ncbi:hypothetical protein FACS1894179_03330 [Bacteroidia bacterium]|nr:hypothetical protein FACS1894169_12820 [Bacteroidia bacterium]GHV39034.1 hypothetical protein FACS1894179_03330 [Bacteroidia bacterium]